MATRRALTLVEVLISIAIIAVLAALLLPVFSRSREAARKVVCLSNERQIYMRLNGAGGPAKGIQVCPDDLNVPSPLTPDYSSYLLNRYLSHSIHGIDAAVNTTQLVLVFDGQGATRTGGPGDAAFRHSGGLDICFADGHVAWVSAAQFQTVEWQPRYTWGK